MRLNLGEAFNLSATDFHLILCYGTFHSGEARHFGWRNIPVEIEDSRRNVVTAAWAYINATSRVADLFQVLKDAVNTPAELVLEYKDEAHIIIHLGDTRHDPRGVLVQRLQPKLICAGGTWLYQDTIADASYPSAWGKKLMLGIGTPQEPLLAITDPDAFRQEAQLMTEHLYKLGYHELPKPDEIRKSRQ